MYFYNIRDASWPQKLGNQSKADSKVSKVRGGANPSLSHDTLHLCCVESVWLGGLLVERCLMRGLTPGQVATV